MPKNVVVVGGGLAGLAAAIYLARAGRRVTLFERRRDLGGRAITHIRQGFRFNIGPHAVYRAGAAWSVFRELGIPVRGGSPDGSGVALANGRRYRLPAGIFSLIATSMLSLKAKAEAVRFLFRLRRLDPASVGSMTVREWLDARIADPMLRQLIEAWLRVASYSAASDEQSAAVALTQLKHARRGTIYVDEGWQKLVDAMHSHAIAAGVNFVTSSRVVRVEHDGASVSGIEVGELEIAHHRDTQSIALPPMDAEGERGTRIPADTVLVAVDNDTARTIIGDFGWPEMKPVAVACLDVALSKLPNPKPTFAIGMDKPIYFSVHSKWAKLTPRGGALVHVAKYLAGALAAEDDIDQSLPTVRGSETERELEAVLDDLQPGWRDVVVHRRFLPAMTVSHALVTPGLQRPPVRTPVRGLYVAGDWTGDEGILSDAALGSARAAARAIIAET